MGQDHTPVNHHQLDMATSGLRGCIPRDVYDRISGNFSPPINNRFKTVEVAGQYILELRRESGRQKGDLERQRKEIEELKIDFAYDKIG